MITLIYTITLSPAIDYFINTQGALDKNSINRALSTSFMVGGKGLNVSIILDTLGIKSTAITLLGGFSGQFIKSSFENHEYCILDVIEVEETTRVNVKLDDQIDKYSINAPGPVATSFVKESIISKLQDVSPNDYVLLCGSRIVGIDDEWLISLANQVRKNKAYLVLDMEQIDLELLAKIKPFLIKPNLDELKILMNIPLDGEINIQESIQTLLDIGVSNVLLTLGKDGALLANSNTQYLVTQHVYHNENDVGMGDAMLGTFIGKLSKSVTTVESLRYAAAAGSATASSKNRIEISTIENELVNIIISNLTKKGRD